jgi:hypothetical protein
VSGSRFLAALPEAVRSLQELDMHRKVQLVVSGGIRSGADAAKPGAGRRRGLDRRRGGSRARGQLPRSMVLEAQTLARACGKSHLHNLEPRGQGRAHAGGLGDG